MGSELIDRLWVINNVIPSELLIFPQKFSISNHKVILVNLDFDQIIESNVRRYTLLIRRLICENEKLQLYSIETSTII